jgi:hypothetical protein
VTTTQMRLKSDINGNNIKDEVIMSQAISEIYE